MWEDSMTLVQVRSLEPVFSTFEGELGWVIPKWLLLLKIDIMIRDQQKLLDQKAQNSP